ncbi:MAG: RagB/SusD family nutrient uptake outer membrane protein [Prevotellaceae bacterium]|jgi:tetratricopeptide (TPR) repeat protein|nr:RagB/SusD family nutrient uptake outer membrane protein [Prevotellaceae bacterium]
MKKKLYILLPLLLFVSFSCNEFLDEMPDNRTELDSKDKITKLLVSAYAERLHILTTEMMSDNIDDIGSALGGSIGRFQDQMFHWEDDIETSDNNESTKSVWESHYLAIANANQALQAIAELGNPADLNPQRGEALISRAYHHFILVNVFCKHYSALTGASDMGIPYMDASETTVDPKYERGTVAGVYEKIEQDIEEALPLIDDNIYTVPKYHFNRKAAFAFAARFYLYYRKYNKVIAYANEVLGANPTTVLRDMAYFGTLPTAAQELNNVAEDYVKPTHNANLLLMTALSYAGRIYSIYVAGKRYCYSDIIAETEGCRSSGPWGEFTTSLYYLSGASLGFSGNPVRFTLFPKIPLLLEYTDPVAGTGYYRTVYPAFQTDETLLCRAEAYIMLQQYEQGVADLNLWATTHVKTGRKVMTPASIDTYYGNMEYYQFAKPTPKKKLNPETPFVSSLQENLIHCLLHIRRIETSFEGLRWFDVKRYGIVIYRRAIDANLQITQVGKALAIDDPRRAIQLPADVITAGLTPNPR